MWTKMATLSVRMVTFVRIQGSPSAVVTQDCRMMEFVGVGKRYILEGRDYNRFNSTSTTDKWCCPASSSCSYEEDGNTVVCTNGTILKGRKAKCSSGVTYDRSQISCRNGQPIDKGRICLGLPICKDRSDIEQCRENNDICPPDSRSVHSRCPELTIKGYGSHNPPERPTREKKSLHQTAGCRH